MLLVYTQAITPRITYVFKHICTRILGIEVGFTSVIEELIAHNGAKLSYGRQPMGNELFVQSHGLLVQHGFESIEITVRPWEETCCFFSVGDKSALPFDIFSATFYLLSRYEEYLPHVKDELGRFPASESLGYKEGFLEQPVVDIWASQFRKVLETSFPQMRFPDASMTIHNIIEAKVPYLYRHRGVFGSMVDYLSDLGRLRVRNMFRRSSVLLALGKDPYNTLEWIVEHTRDSNNLLSVFFLLGEAHSFKHILNTRKNRFKMLIKYVGDYARLGLVFSFGKLTNHEGLKHQKKYMEEITHRTVCESMNALYKIDLPEIYRNLVALEVTTDFSMVYDETVGFRAGTCTPFLFYDLDYEVQTPLVIHPIAGTSKGLVKKKPREIIQCIDDLHNAVSRIGGIFSFILSNRDFVENQSHSVWRNIFVEKLQKYE